MNATTTPTAMTVKSGRALPSIAQRKPSMTPTIGFRLYKIRHFSGMMVTEYTTGEAYIQNWTRKGIACPTSRYFTLSAERYRLTATDVTTARRIKNGSASTPHVGAIPYHTIMPSRITNEIAKSTTGPSAPQIGTLNRRK